MPEHFETIGEAMNHISQKLRQETGVERTGKQILEFIMVRNVEYTGEKLKTTVASAAFVANVVDRILSNEPAAEAAYMALMEPEDRDDFDHNEIQDNHDYLDRFAVKERDK